MINANELRIGNWLLTDEDEMLQVNEIKQDFNDCEYMITFITSDDMYHDSIISECNPISLTEEILFKCGFVRTGLLYELGDCHFAIKIYNDKFLLANPTYQMVYELNNFASLHQLQNLYFALTGEELNVEL